MVTGKDVRMAIDDGALASIQGHVAGFVMNIRKKQLIRHLNGPDRCVERTAFAIACLYGVILG